MARIHCFLAHSLLNRTNLVLAILLLALVGCASLDEGQCRAGRWGELGFSDGAQGLGVDRLNDHRKACAEFGIAPDPGSYLLAREQGLLQYCTPTHAMQEGLAGRPYRDVCPPALDARFAPTHRAALTVYQARQAVGSAYAESQQAESELRSDKLAPDRRKFLNEELRRLDFRLMRLRGDLRAAERDLDRVLRAP